MSKLRELIDEPSYEASVEALGGARAVDEALAPIIDGLCRAPEGFDLIPGHGQLRLAKTRRITRRTGHHIPAVGLWFYIHDDGTVRKLHVEELVADEQLDDPF